MKIKDHFHYFSYLNQEINFKKKQIRKIVMNNNRIIMKNANEKKP